MNALKTIGKETIGNYEFTGIEGGFGKGKKAMLVKDIAKIHDKPLKAINQAINMNLKRFNVGIDVIDILKTQSIRLTDFFTKQQIANSKNIYILSERGYAKLLKILDDDKAWDIYDLLVDNYFNMRQAINTDSKAILHDKRLAIMEDNSKTRKAALLLKIAKETKSETAKEQLLSKSAFLITGEFTIPVMKNKEYTASDIAKELNITSNKVGRISNKLNLKAEQPQQNEYGRWAVSKSKYSSKEVAQWVYFEKGKKKIERELNKDKE